MENETGAAASAAASRATTAKAILKPGAAAETAAPVSFSIVIFHFNFDFAFLFFSRLTNFFERNFIPKIFRNLTNLFE